MRLVSALRRRLSAGRSDQLADLTAVARFGEVPAVSPFLGEWLRRARRYPAPRQLREAQPFLADAEHAADDDFAALSSLLARALDRLTDDQLAEVSVDERVRAYLGASGRRDRLADFCVERAFIGDNVVTRLAGSRVLADYGRHHPEGIAERLVELTAEQSPLELRIRRCRRVGTAVEIELIAVVRVIDFGTSSPVFTVRQRGQELPVSTLGDPAATRFSNRRFQSHDAGSLLITLPAVDDVEVAVRIGEVERRAVLSGKRIRARLPQPAGPGAVTGAEVIDGRLQLRGAGIDLALTYAPFGLPERPLPSGPLDLGGDLTVSEELAGLLPHLLYTPDHLIELTADKGRLRVRLLAPLTDDERGRYRQQQLQAITEPVDRSTVLFSTYAGRLVTDSPLAIFAELRRRRPDLRLLWSVADHSVPVPEGAEAVVEHSTAWHRAWAGAHLIVTNVEVHRSFTPSPEQTLVQTFHGYPSKLMGQVLWRSKNFSPRRVEHQLDRTSRTWNVLLTPDPSMDRHYLEQYDVRGTILNRGYPRNDALVAPDAEERRAAVRARLGIGDDQVAVLNAPTWRDNAATDFRSAPLAAHLDLDRVREALGDRVVVLQRGHRFNTPGGDRSGAIDVTSYPEINDLILAADAAVLDYSSLRFDFAITGKPMIFLVPDLEEYAGEARGFLFPFEESAPGPLVESTEAVIAELADLDALRADHAASIAAFNERYNRWHDGQAAARATEAILNLLESR